MHPPVVQAFLQWQQTLSAEDRAVLDAFLAERAGPPARGSAAAPVHFGGRRVGQTPSQPVGSAPARGVCPACHRPLP